MVENGKTEQIVRGGQGWMSSFSTRKTKTGKTRDSDGDRDKGESDDDRDA